MSTVNFISRRRQPRLSRGHRRGGADQERRVVLKRVAILMNYCEKLIRWHLEYSFQKQKNGR